jgi:hypothetical protein
MDVAVLFFLDHIVPLGVVVPIGTSPRQEDLMLLQPQLIFFVSVAFGFLTWGVVTARYIWPALRNKERSEALQPVLMLHSFRFLGLATLVPGVVSPDLPTAFARPEAYGDLIAAVLALLTLFLLPRNAGVLLAWIFNIWGTLDLLNAFYQGNAAGLPAGQMGATYFIPTLFVPILLITHGLAFRILLQPQSKSVLQQNLRPA